MPENLYLFYAWSFVIFLEAWYVWCRAVVFRAHKVQKLSLVVLSRGRIQDHFYSRQVDPACKKSGACTGMCMGMYVCLLLTRCSPIAKQLG
jgi:hypothetical protein